MFQCLTYAFCAVGWATGRGYGLYKTSASKPLWDAITEVYIQLYSPYMMVEKTISQSKQVKQ